MCTLSWNFNSLGYTVFFNRDELNSRQEAEIPSVRSIEDIRVISPRDGDRGGTWISVNEYGVVSCLLNLYGDPHPKGEFLSRGMLVRDLSTAFDWKDTATHLNSKCLGDYPPFQFVQFFPTGLVHRLKWTGQSSDFSTLTESDIPLSGSSFRNDEVVAVRMNTYEATMKNCSNHSKLEFLEQFHRSYIPDRGAFSVNMLRDDAKTVSLSRVDVFSDHVEFRYQGKARSGFEFSEPVVVSLSRRRERLC